MANLLLLQVKIQPVAKYDWEHKYYYGRLIAVSSAFLAYAIKGEARSITGIGCQADRILRKLLDFSQMFC